MKKQRFVDTVKHKFATNLVENISELTSLEKIDYIIVNHVEMDHSSSLPIIAKLWQKTQKSSPPHAAKKNSSNITVPNSKGLKRSNQATK